LRGGGWGRAKAIWNFGVERCSVNRQEKIFDREATFTAKAQRAQRWNFILREEGDFGIVVWNGDSPRKTNN